MLLLAALAKWLLRSAPIRPPFLLASRRLFFFFFFFFFFHLLCLLRAFWAGRREPGARAGFGHARRQPAAGSQFGRPSRGEKNGRCSPSRFLLSLSLSLSPPPPPPTPHLLPLGPPLAHLFGSLVASQRAADGRAVRTVCSCRFAPHALVGRARAHMFPEPGRPRPALGRTKTAPSWAHCTRLNHLPPRSAGPQLWGSALAGGRRAQCACAPAVGRMVRQWAAPVAWSASALWPLALVTTFWLAKLVQRRRGEFCVQLLLQVAAVVVVVLLCTRSPDCHLNFGQRARRAKT